MPDVKSIITDAARRYGQNPDDALRIASVESSFNPSAQNKESSAGGLFQFVDGTWDKYAPGKSKFDPEANADAGMRLMRDNAKYLTKVLGRAPTAGELYLAHQQGAGGAQLLLENPQAKAVDLLGSKKVLANGGNENMTAAEFAQLWTKKIEGTSVDAPLVSGGAAPASMEASSDSKFNVNQPAAISYEDVVPNTAVPSEVPQQKADPNAPGFWEGAGLAIYNNWSILAPFRMLGHYEPDPNWRLNQDRLKELRKDIPDEYLSEFEDAVSDQHAQAIRQRLLKQMEVNQRLASMGAEGTVLQMGAALTDPGAWAATAAISAASGGLGLAPAVAARLGRVGMVGLSAAEGVAGNLMTDVPLNAVNPTSTKNDLLWSIGTGLMMGGAVGAIRRNPAFLPEADALEQTGKAMRKEAVDRVAEQQQIIEPKQSIAGANATNGQPMFRTNSEEKQTLFRRLAKDAEVVYGKARFDLAGQLLKSKNPMVKVVARYLVEDAVRAKPGQVTAIAASETQARLFRVSTTEWARGYSKAWDKYRKANNIGFFQSAEGLEKFRSEVASYIRETDPFKKAAFSSEVKEAGEVFNGVMRKWWKMAQEEGLTRTEMGVDNYFPRYLDLASAREKVHRFGYDKSPSKGGIASLFAGAVMKAQPHIEPALAHKLGYAIVDRMHKLQAGEELLRKGFGGYDDDELKDLLEGYMSPDEIDSVLSSVNHKTPNEEMAGGNARLKHRILFDESFSAPVRDRYGAVEELKVSDFYINDPNLAMHLYSRQMSGGVAMARMKIRDPETGELVLDGIRNRNDWETFKKDVIGVGDLEHSDNATDIENLDFAYDAIMGVPRKSEQGDWPTFLKLLRDFNFMRLMGQVGFSQLPEIGRTAASTGLKALYQGMPTFRQIIKAAREGHMGDEFSDELDAIGSFGSDYIRTKFHINSDDFGTPVTLGGNTAIQRFAGKVNPKLHAMNRFTSLYSGMAPINGLYQRWASRAFAVKFVRMAKFGDKVDMNRLMTLGLSKEDADLIFENIRKHATFKNGIEKPSKMNALGMKNWDGKAVAAFESAMWRASRNMIQENDIGQFAKWMGHPLGKVFLQFRTFTIGSWTKSLLQGMNMRDAEAALAFGTTAFLGALTYVAQTHLNLMGDKDAEKKRRERLSWGKIAAAGFQRTSESSLTTIPMDLMAEMVTGDAIFDTRSSGLSTSVQSLGGNPTADLLETGWAGVTGVTSAAFGDDYSRRDFQALTKTLPFQRMMGFVQFYNWLAGSMKKYEAFD